MENQIRCPHCQSTKVKRISKKTQLLLGIAVALIGAIFILVAETNGVGYYMFALPLLTVGSIGAYKQYSNPLVKAHCHDCNESFEYLMN